VTAKLETFLRRATVVLAALALPVVLAGPASAEVPEGWSDPAAVEPLEALLILVGAPLLLMLLIAAAVYVPPLARGESITPGAPELENQWFGGPRGGTHELESGTTTSDTGGASGRW
jgi:hypothetical protein